MTKNVILRTWSKKLKSEGKQRHNILSSYCNLIFPLGLILNSLWTGQDLGICLVQLKPTIVCLNT